MILSLEAVGQKQSSGSGPPTHPPSQDCSQWLFRLMATGFRSLYGCGAAGGLHPSSTLLSVMCRTKKKVRTLLKQRADLPYLKSYIEAHHSSPLSVSYGPNRWQVFWLASHPPGAFPVFRPVTYCPLSSLTAVGPRGLCTPLPYQALAGTTIRYLNTAYCGYVRATNIRIRTTRQGI